MKERHFSVGDDHVSPVLPVSRLRWNGLRRQRHRLPILVIKKFLLTRLFLTRSLRHMDEDHAPSVTHRLAHKYLNISAVAPTFFNYLSYIYINYIYISEYLRRSNFLALATSPSLSIDTSQLPWPPIHDPVCLILWNSVRNQMLIDYTG
jgi:hypothetical protein